MNKKWGYVHLLFCLLLFYSFPLFSLPIGNNNVQLVDFTITEKTKEFVLNEGVEYRYGLAMTVTYMIPDDVLRSNFIDREYIIDKYSRSPSSWHNYEDHFYGLNLVNATRNVYNAFVDALKSQNWDDAAMYYGVLAHYIADASDPFNAYGEIDDYYNESLAFEIFLDLNAEYIFQYIYNTRHIISKSDIADIETGLKELNIKSQSAFDVVVEAVRNNDTASLLYELKILGYEATVLLYTIVLNAFDQAGLNEVVALVIRASPYLAYVVGVIFIAIFVHYAMKKVGWLPIRRGLREER